MTLFDPDVLDRLEGLNARYALLSKRLEELQDRAAAYDRTPERSEIETFEGLRRKVRQDAVDLLEKVLEALHRT